MTSKLNQIKLFPADSPFVGMTSTRYQGSKRKLLEDLYSFFISIDFMTCLDAFGGTGSVTHLLSGMGKHVTYNDILPANATIARALFTAGPIELSEESLEKLHYETPGVTYKRTISEIYGGVYFTDAENEQLDIICQNILALPSKTAQAESYYCLFQSAISKRPYNLFHRANLNMRLRDVERSFGNKATWEKSFNNHMRKHYKELRAYRNSKAYVKPVVIKNLDAFTIKEPFDLVYIDTPYAKSKGLQESNYFNFYHFLDVLIDYDNVQCIIFDKYPHKPYYEPNKLWYSTDTIDKAFELLFNNYSRSILAVSYRSDGHPSPKYLIDLMKTTHRDVSTINLKDYNYVFSSQKKNTIEILISGYPR